MQITVGRTPAGYSALEGPVLRAFIVGAILAVAVSAHAQQPGDALAECVAKNTSSADRKAFAKFYILALAAHPELKPYVNADLQRASDEAARAYAALYMRLYTESCVNETRAVVRGADGPKGMQLIGRGFGTLGMQELLADKAVQEAMASVIRYLDQKRLTEILGGK